MRQVRMVRMVPMLIEMMAAARSVSAFRTRPPAELGQATRLPED